MIWSQTFWFEQSEMMIAERKQAYLALHQIKIRPQTRGGVKNNITVVSSQNNDILISHYAHCRFPNSDAAQLSVTLGI